MPVANQYGVDLGNILSTVSELKTAQQNRDTNALKNDMLSRQNDEEIAAKKAEDDFRKDPTTATATSIAQRIGWDQFNSEQKQISAATMKDSINKHGIAVKGMMDIQDPSKQKEALQQYVTTLSPDEQKEVVTKYGSTPDEWQANLPHIMNDLLLKDGGVSLLQKQAEEKTKHENKLEEVNALYDNKNDLLDKTLKNKLDVANLNADSRESIAKYKASHPTANGKPTVLEMKAAALVDGGDAKDINSAIRMIIKAGKETNVDDPVMGNKTITSKPVLGNGNALKDPPPLVKVNSRDQAVQAIKAKYPKASQTQIDSYLKSKGL